MQRKSKSVNKADAIFVADIHLMSRTPICRTDDFENKTQWEKMDWLKALQQKHQCPVIHSGDLFDFWKPSPELLAKTIQHLPDRFHTVYGNHDLPQHSMELKHKCGIYVLAQSGNVITVNTGNWGDTPNPDNAIIIKGRKILPWHVYCYQGAKPFPGATGRAAGLLRKNPDFDVIVTGDNHMPFTETYKGRLLVNPGSLFRIKSDQINHKPRVYLYYADTNTILPEYLPIKDSISKEHNEEEKKRSSRISAFIKTLKSDSLDTLSFEENLNKFITANKIQIEVTSIIHKSIDYETTEKTQIKKNAS